jgi:hypothetical protein
MDHKTVPTCFDGIPDNLALEIELLSLGDLG